MLIRFNKAMIEPEFKGIVEVIKMCMKIQRCLSHANNSSGSV